MSYQDQIHLYAERACAAIDGDIEQRIVNLGVLLGKEGELHCHDNAIQFNFHQKSFIKVEVLDFLLEIFHSFEIVSSEYGTTFWIEAVRKDADGFETRIVVFC